MYMARYFLRKTCSNMKPGIKWLCTSHKLFDYSEPILHKRREIKYLDTSIPQTSRLTIFVQKNTFHRSYTNSEEISDREFEKLKSKGVTVIDVRESNEIKTSGTIPGSINIPLKKLNSALKQTPEAFKAKYGTNKPDKDNLLVFLCQRGSRSRMAMESAARLGYNKTMSIRGGWESLSKD